MGLLETVKEIAGFAEDSPAAGVNWSYVVFHEGAVWAQSMGGSALAKTPEIDISIACPAKRLLKAVQAVGANPKLKVKDLKLEIQGEDGSATVAGLRVSDAPKVHFPDAKAEWIAVPGLCRAESLGWCVSKDITRKNLIGFHLGDSGVVEATDGHALVQLNFLGVNGFKDSIVPPQVFSGLGPESWVAWSGNRVFVSSQQGGEGGFRSGALIEGKFAPAERIISSAEEQPKIRFAREDFIKMLKKAKLSGASVILDVHGDRISVIVDGESPDSLFGFVSGIPIEAVGESREGKIGFSVNLLLSVFGSASSPEVEVYLSPSKSGGIEPLMVRDGAFVGLVMPCRL